MNPFDTAPAWAGNGPPPARGSATSDVRLSDWDTNLADATGQLPLRDPEFGLTYLRRREESERHHGIEQFLRFANQAAPLDSHLNADDEYPAPSTLGSRVWPYFPPGLAFADATLARPGRDGDHYPGADMRPDEWIAAAERELLESSWMEGPTARMAVDGNEYETDDDDDDEGEMTNEFEIGDWGEEDDDDDDQLRAAMLELAQASNRHAPTFDRDWTSHLFDSATDRAGLRAQELADRNATAAERSLRQTYGLDDTEDRWAMNYYDYLGVRPSHPPTESTSNLHARPSVTRPSMFDLLEDRAKTKRTATDPCSALSWTSFLAPGMILAGSQVFTATAAPNSSTSTNRSNAQSGSDYATRTSALRAAYAPPPPRSRSSMIPLVPPVPLSVTAPQTAEIASSSTLGRLREFGRRPPAFESLLAVLREDVRDPNRPERFSDFANRVNLDVAALATAAMIDQPAKPERWSVEVTVLSYDPEARALTGLMHALGFAGQAEPPTITTHLQGEILSPGTDGLWTPTSAKSLPLTDWGIKRAAQAGRHWASIGPFKDVGKEELTAKAADLKWLRRKTKGWVLMRWKETGFVNVARKSTSD